MGLHLSWASVSGSVYTATHQLNIGTCEYTIQDQFTLYICTPQTHTKHIGEYLLQLPYNLATLIVQLRMSNHKSPVQKGRLQNILKSQRPSTCIGDQFHVYLCPSLQNLRLKCLPN